MKFPLGIDEINLLLAAISIILLATTELMNPKYGQTPFILEKSNLRTTARVIGFLFLSTLVIKIYQIIITI